MILMNKLFILVRYICILFLFIVNFKVSAQSVRQDTLLETVSLADCINYALKHQPLIQQSAIDEEIVTNTVKSRLADWYPQVAVNYNLLHYFQLPVAFTPDANGNKHAVRTGVANTSGIGFSVNQNIFNRDVLLANRTAADVLQQSRQRTISNKIDAVVEVSRAFYDVLLTERQVQVLDENIVRLRRSLQDAYNQYQGGIVDKTDYKRAQIALNNTIAERKRIAETIEAKFVNLKQLMARTDLSQHELAVTERSIPNQEVADHSDQHATQHIGSGNAVQHTAAQQHPAADPASQRCRAGSRQLIVGQKSYHRPEHSPAVERIAGQQIEQHNREVG